MGQALCGPPPAAATAAAPGVAKAILVSGGSSGIGLALCQQLLVDHGCRVFLGARSPAKGLAALASLELPEEVGARCTVVSLEVCSAESVQKAVASVREALQGGALYAVVNNAGTGLAHNVTEQQVLDTNLYGVKRVVDAFQPLLDKDTGRIVNVGSGAAGGYVKTLGETDEARMLMNGEATWEDLDKYVQGKLRSNCGAGIAYGLSKACLAAYTQVLATESPSILSSCCSPGFIDTAITNGYGASKGPEEGTFAIKKLLFEDMEGNGWYYGSDGLRSPYHYMRSPSQPAYDGKMPF